MGTLSGEGIIAANGGTGNYTITVTGLNGYSQPVYPVEFSAWEYSTYPPKFWNNALVTASLPSTIQPNSSVTLSIGPFNIPDAPPYTATNYYSLCLLGGYAHCTAPNAPIGLNVTSSPNFFLGVSGPQIVSSLPGTANYTVSVVSASGFSGVVALSVSGLPSGVSASFSPGSVSLSPTAPQAQSVVTVSVPAGTPVGSYSFTAAGAGGGLSQTATGSLAVSGPSQVIQTAPSGLVLSVDGAACTTPCSYPWAAGTTHTVSIAATIAGATGTQYIFSNWSDGNGSPSRTITVGSTPAAYTANFTTQYYLTTSVAPASAGTIYPASGWYNSGTLLAVTATPATGYQFSNFSGSLTGTSSSGYFSVAGTGTITANFGAPVSTPLPDLTDMAMLSMFVERHQWLLSQPGYSTSGLYNIPSGDLATVNSAVAATQAQLAQLASQSSFYISQGDAWVSARNAILQSLRAQLQSGISASSYQALASYMTSTILPSITAQPLTADSGSTAQSACPAGDTCAYISALISFYSGGLGGRIDTWVEGPDAPKFCVGENSFKPLFDGVAFPASASDANCGASVDHSYVGFTTKDPKSGTYEVQAFQTVSGDGISEPPFTNLFQVSQPAGTWEFLAQNGYDMLSTPVALGLNVSQPAGVPDDPSGQNAVLTSCSGSIVVQANLTPQLPPGNTVPPITWNTGSPGVDSLHRVVPCPAANTTTTVAAAIGANLSASLAVSFPVVPQLQLSPSDVSVGPGQSFTITASGQPVTSASTYNWQIVETQSGDNPNAFSLQSSSCQGASSCSATITATSTGLATVQVTYQDGSASVTQTARIRSISATITQIWTDQFENGATGNGNYLPGGAGLVGNAHQLMIMGARADGNAYLKASVSTVPNNQEALNHVLVRFQYGLPSFYNTSQPVGGCSVGSACVVGSTFSLSMPYSASSGSTEADYSVVVGPDVRNGGQAGGMLYASEISPTGVFTLPCAVEVPDDTPPCSYGAVRIVSSVAYTSYRGAVTTAITANNFTVLPTAAAFLNAFVSPMSNGDPGGAIVGTPTFSTANFLPLVFDTGVDFGNPTVPVYTFDTVSENPPTMSPLGFHVMNDPDFQLMLTYTLTAHNQDVLNFFNNPSNANVLTTTLPTWSVIVGCPTDPDHGCPPGTPAAAYFQSSAVQQVDIPAIFPCYSDSGMECDLIFINDADLRNAFGRVGYSLVIQATVSRSVANPTSQFVLQSLSVSGYIYDQYELNPFIANSLPLGINFGDHQMADVQAGYMSLGNGGQVYQTYVVLVTNLTTLAHTFQ